jgi:nuclear GTP-binding protein
MASARTVLTDWNHQKIPYFTVPPAVHPSSIPSVVPNTSSSVVAPGAEKVGQAQILAELSKPFELEGLFGAADAGAFGQKEPDENMEDGEGGEAEMDEDHAWVIWWNGFNDGCWWSRRNNMETEDFALQLPQKRSRSASVGSTYGTIGQDGTSDKPSRASKKLRLKKEIPEYDTPVDEHTSRAMARSNPLNRKVLKNEAKRARRAATKAMKAAVGGGQMEIDDTGNAGLEFTFMAWLGGKRRLQLSMSRHPGTNSVVCVIVPSTPNRPLNEKKTIGSERN